MSGVSKSLISWVQDYVHLVQNSAFISVQNIKTPSKYVLNGINEIQSNQGKQFMFTKWILFLCLLMFSRTIQWHNKQCCTVVKSNYCRARLYTFSSQLIATSCVILDKLYNLSVTYCLFPHLSNGNNRTSLIVIARIVCFSTA